MNLHFVAGGLVGVVILIHLYIVVLEMLLWKMPHGRKVFGMTPEFARESRVLAANQGLYNGFLAAGLFWGLWLGVAGRPILLFFLGCVLVAGIYGGLTASRKVLWIQALPAALGLLLVSLA